MNYNKELWSKLVDEGGKVAPDTGTDGSIINHLDRDDINTIIATMDFFGATLHFKQQAAYDLSRPKFRTFDWLAMNVMGRNDFGSTTRECNNVALKVLVHSFIKSGYDERKFIDDLREWDYEIDDSWESIQIDV